MTKRNLATYGGAMTLKDSDLVLERVLQHYRPAEFIASEIFPIILDESRPCKEHKITVDVRLKDKANADPIFVNQFEEGRCLRAIDALYLDWEIRMEKLFASVNTTFIPRVPWTDYFNSYPHNDLLTCVYGLEPTHILMSSTAWHNFRRNVEVREMCGKSFSIYPSLDQLEDLLKVKILVGSAWMYRAENEGDLELTLVWGDSVYLYHIPKKPDFNTASFGYCIQSQPINVERQPYDTRRHTENIEITYRQDEIIVDGTMCSAIRNTTGL